MFQFGALACGFLLLTFASPIQGDTLLNAGFGSITTLAGDGWLQVNNSYPAGTTGWFQGNDGIFPSQAGATDAYVAANYLNADLGGNISNWLITPTFIFDGGFNLSFYTRTETDAPTPDRLEVRLSTSGSSVGSTDTSVGDFTTLLLTVNPLLSPSAYPESWTEETATVFGLGNSVTGRLAFRYYVTDTTVNGDYIGIDSVEVDSASVPEPASILLVAVGLAAVLRPRAFRRRHTDQLRQ